MQTRDRNFKSEAKIALELASGPKIHPARS